MNIGQAAKASGVHAKMIRHYEATGIVPKAARTNTGYRVYSEVDVHTLRFVKRARSLGFSMKDIKKLVSLWRNKNRASAEVKSLALARMQEIEQKMAELAQMAATLRHLAEHCRGDQRPECPILENLSN